jgi:hypothetical protein
MGIAMKTVKWIAIVLFAVISLTFIYYWYLIATFDAEALPQNHGRVNTRLYLGEGENQPLIVGFGGSEGGNAWASDYWKPQRDHFLAQG